jgi:hypothetical protein
MSGESEIEIIENNQKTPMSGTLKRVPVQQEDTWTNKRLKTN